MTESERQLELYRKTIAEMKFDIKKLVNAIRGFDIEKSDEDDDKIRFSGETVYLSKAQKILLDEALAVVEKYKNFML